MSSSESPRGSSRRFLWLAVAIVAMIGLYSGGWYWIAGQVETGVDRTIAALRAGGDDADCTNRGVRGYPFRVGLFCDAVRFTRADSSVSVEGTGLRSAANV